MARPGMTKKRPDAKISLPSFLTTGLVSACRKFCALCDATLTDSWLGGRGVENALRDDLCSHAADAGTGQADRAGGARGQVKHPAADERAAVVDGHDDATAAMGHPELGTERQRTVGRRQGILIEMLARGGLAAGFVAIKGSNPREAASGAR